MPPRRLSNRRDRCRGCLRSASPPYLIRHFNALRCFPSIFKPCNKRDLVVTSYEIYLRWLCGGSRLAQDWHLATIPPPPPTTVTVTPSRDSQTQQASRPPRQCTPCVCVHSLPPAPAHRPAMAHAANTPRAHSPPCEVPSCSVSCRPLWAACPLPTCSRSALRHIGRH